MFGELTATNCLHERERNCLENFPELLVVRFQRQTIANDIMAVSLQHSPTTVKNTRVDTWWGFLKYSRGQQKSLLNLAEWSKCSKNWLHSLDHQLAFFLISYLTPNWNVVNIAMAANTSARPTILDTCKSILHQFYHYLCNTLYLNTTQFYSFYFPNFIKTLKKSLKVNSVQFRIPDFLRHNIGRKEVFLSNSERVWWQKSGSHISIQQSMY